MTTVREPIYAGLAAQLAAIPGLTTFSRKLKHWVDVPSEQMPALYLAQGDERIDEPHLGAGSRVYLMPKLYLYVHTTGDIAPGTVLNPILDAIQNVVNQRHPVLRVNNLGGVPGVEWARIDGAIQTFEGTLGDLEVAIIPIAILTADDGEIVSSQSSQSD